MGVMVRRETAFAILSPKLNGLLKRLISQIHGNPEVEDLENLNDLMELVLVNRLLGDFFVEVRDGEWNDLDQDIIDIIYDLIVAAEEIIREETDLDMSKMNVSYLEFLEPNCLRVIF